MASVVACWALGSAVLLTGPALADHLLAVLRPGPVVVRLCELALLAENARRLLMFLRLAAARRSLQSRKGRNRLWAVHKTVCDLFDGSGTVTRSGLRTTVERLVLHRQANSVLYAYHEALLGMPTHSGGNPSAGASSRLSYLAV